MKLNKKVIAPAFMLLAGASLVGSVTGTIAWYQYSTRANVSYIGSSAGTIGNLQVRLAGGEWGTQVRTDDVLDYLAAQNIGQKVEPVTPGNLEKDGSLKHGNWKEMAEIPFGEQDPDTAGADTSKKYLQIDGINPAKLFKYENSAWAEDDSIDLENAAPDVDAASVGDQYINLADKKLYEKELADNNFYLNPIFGYGPYNQWTKASSANYVKIPLQLRFIEGDEQHLTAQNVYLTKLLIQKDTGRDAQAAQHGDISEAVRVHFSVYEDGDEDNAVNRLVSKKGGTTLTNGHLKLGNGDDFDKAYDEGDDWGFDGSSYDYVEYGAGRQVSYAALSEASEGYYYEEETPATGWKEIASFTSDIVAPDNGQGNDGEYYYKTDTHMLYLKSSGLWTLVDNIIYGNDVPNLETPNPNSYNYYVQEGYNKLFLRVPATHEDIDPILVKQSANNPLVLEDITNKELGETVATSDPQKYLNVDVTIWVEGWQKFNKGGNYSSLWNQDLIGAMFDVGMQFAVQDLNA